MKSKNRKMWALNSLGLILFVSFFCGFTERSGSNSIIQACKEGIGGQFVDFNDVDEDNNNSNRAESEENGAVWQPES